MNGKLMSVDKLNPSCSVAVFCSFFAAKLKAPAIQP